MHENIVSLIIGLWEKPYIVYENFVSDFKLVYDIKISLEGNIFICDCLVGF